MLDSYRELAMNIRCFFMLTPNHHKLIFILALVSVIASFASYPVAAKQVSFAGYNAAKASRWMATYYSDLMISKRVKSILKRELDAAVKTIVVDTHSGIVSLSGAAKNAAIFKRAVELAWSIKGVKQVVPSMQVPVSETKN